MTENTEDSKTVKDYLDAQKSLRNSAETLQLNLRRAYDEALEGTREGDYVRTDKLANEADREQFKNALISGLLNPLQGSIKALPEDPLFAEDLAMNSFYGFTREIIMKIVDSAKEKLTAEGYMQTLFEKTDLKRVIETRKQASYGPLDNVSTEDVLKHVGVKAKNPSMVTLEDKVNLIGQFEEAGAVPPKYLEDKSYMK